MTRKKSLFLAVASALSLSPITSHAATALVYTINVSGFVLNSGGPTFRKTGVMIINPTITSAGTRNGVNPYDFALSTGAIWSAPPAAGALQFFTNSKLASSSEGVPSTLIMSALDLAYVSASGNCITIQPDSTILSSLYDSNPDKFLARSELTAQVYQVQSGTVKLCTNDGGRTFTGNISLKGNSYFQSFLPVVTYQAVMTASFIGTKPL